MCFSRKVRIGAGFPAIILSALSLTLLCGYVFAPLKAVASEDVVRLELVGHEDVRCGIEDLAPVFNLGNLDRAGAGSLSFTFDCNAPFAYSVTSQNGALTPIGTAPAAASAAHLPYSVQIRIPTTGGGTLADECTSAALLAPPSCAFSNSGAAIASGEAAQLSIIWASARDARLLAGLYSDRLTLTVSPRL
jgi:hypothetical protein